MNIRHLNVFVSVCETGSVTKTAETIHIAQPAVSQTIRELETYYSVELFHRINRKLVLTDQGRLLYLKAKELLAGFDEFEGLAHQFTLHPTVKVGTSLTNAPYTLDRIRGYVQEHHGNMSVYSYVNNAGEIVDRICSGELDFAIIEGFSTDPSIASVELHADPLAAVCGQTFDCPSQMALSDLAQLPLLLRERGSSSRDHLETRCAEANVRLNPVMESASNHAIIHAAVCGYGVAILPKVLVQHELQAGQLREIALEGTQLVNSSHLVWHKGRRFSSQLKDIFEFCKTAM